MGREHCFSVGNEAGLVEELHMADDALLLINNNASLVYHLHKLVGRKAQHLNEEIPWSQEGRTEISNNENGLMSFFH